MHVRNRGGGAPLRWMTADAQAAAANGSTTLHDWRPLQNLLPGRNAPFRWRGNAAIILRNAAFR